LRPTQVTSTTVSSMVTSTAPSAWRAISPVSSVTVWRPKGNVFLIDFIGGILWSVDRMPARGGNPESKNPASAGERPRGSRRPALSLLPQAEALDERAVALDVAALQVIEQAAALAHHLQQPAARVEIL